MTLDELKDKLAEEDKWMKEHPVKAFFIDSYNLFRRGIPSKIENTYWRAKFAIQRAFRGYDDTAYWNLDGYITDIALPVLKWYRQNKHGIPGDMTEKEWDDKLDKMILAFQTMKNYDEVVGDVNDKEMDVLVKEGLKEFAEHFRSLCD